MVLCKDCKWCKKKLFNPFYFCKNPICFEDSSADVYSGVIHKRRKIIWNDLIHYTLDCKWMNRNLDCKYFEKKRTIWDYLRKR